MSKTPTLLDPGAEGTDPAWPRRRERSPSPRQTIQARARHCRPGRPRLRSFENNSSGSKSTTSPTKGDAQIQGLSHELQLGHRLLQDFTTDRYKAVGSHFVGPEYAAGKQAAPPPPICLGAMRERFARGRYQNLAEVVSDLRLVVETCYRARGVDHWLSKRAQRMELIMEQKLALLSRPLREQTSLYATTNGRYGNDDDRSSGLVSSRRRAATRSAYSSSPAASAGESAMVTAIRAEEQQKARDERRVRDQERREAEEASLRHAEEWEQTLFSMAAPLAPEELWELPAVGHFLCLAQSALGLPELAFYELERCLLMPRASSFLARIMTALLLPPHRRHKHAPGGGNTAGGSAGAGRSMSYAVWERRLRERVRTWYADVSTAPCAAVRARALGLPPQLFVVLGESSPLESRSFHQLSLTQRVWLLKGLCEHVFETERSVQAAVLAQPIHECREVILGYDAHDFCYIHFPQFCGLDFRVYKQAPLGPPAYPSPPIHVRGHSASSGFGSTKADARCTSPGAAVSSDVAPDVKAGVKREWCLDKCSGGCGRSGCIRSSEVSGGGSNDTGGVGSGYFDCGSQTGGSGNLDIGDGCGGLVRSGVGGCHRGQLSGRGDCKRSGDIDTLEDGVSGGTEGSCASLSSQLVNGLCFTTPATASSISSSSTSSINTMKMIKKMMKTSYSQQRGHNKKRKKRRKKRKMAQIKESCQDDVIQPDIETLFAKSADGGDGRGDGNDGGTENVAVTVKKRKMSTKKKEKTRKGKRPACANIAKKLKEGNIASTSEPQFKLVCRNLQDLRDLIAEVEKQRMEIDNGVRRKTEKKSFRRRRVKDLHETLLRLLNELVPWEQKLHKAAQRMRSKMKKEYDDFLARVERGDEVDEEEEEEWMSEEELEKRIKEENEEEGEVQGSQTGKLPCLIPDGASFDDGSNDSSAPTSDPEMVALHNVRLASRRKRGRNLSVVSTTFTPLATADITTTSLTLPPSPKRARTTNTTSNGNHSDTSDFDEDEDEDDEETGEEDERKWMASRADSPTEVWTPPKSSHRRHSGNAKDRSKTKSKVKKKGKGQASQLAQDSAASKSEKKCEAGAIAGAGFGKVTGTSTCNTIAGMGTAALARLIPASAKDSENMTGTGAGTQSGTIARTIAGTGAISGTTANSVAERLMRLMYRTADGRLLPIDLSGGQVRVVSQSTTDPRTGQAVVQQVLLLPRSFLTQCQQQQQQQQEKAKPVVAGQVKALVKTMTTGEMQSQMPGQIKIQTQGQTQTLGQIQTTGQVQKMGSNKKQTLGQVTIQAQGLTQTLGQTLSVTQIQTLGQTQTPVQINVQTSGQAQAKGQTHSIGQIQMLGQTQTPGQIRIQTMEHTPTSGQAKVMGQVSHTYSHTPGQSQTQTCGQTQTLMQIQTQTLAQTQTPGQIKMQEPTNTVGQIKIQSLGQLQTLGQTQAQQQIKIQTTGQRHMQEQAPLLVLEHTETSEQIEIQTPRQTHASEQTSTNVQTQMPRQIQMLGKTQMQALGQTQVSGHTKTQGQDVFQTVGQTPSMGQSQILGKTLVRTIAQPKTQGHTQILGQMETKTMLPHKNQSLPKSPTQMQTNTQTSLGQTLDPAPKPPCNRSSAMATGAMDPSGQVLKTFCVHESQSILVTTRGGNTGLVRVRSPNSVALPSPELPISPTLRIQDTHAGTTSSSSIVACRPSSMTASSPYSTTPVTNCRSFGGANCSPTWTAVAPAIAAAGMQGCTQTTNTSGGAGGGEGLGLQPVPTTQQQQQKFILVRGTSGPVALANQTCFTLPTQPSRADPTTMDASTPAMSNEQLLPGSKQTLSPAQSSPVRSDTGVFNFPLMATVPAAPGACRLVRGAVAGVQDTPPRTSCALAIQTVKTKHLASSFVLAAAAAPHPSTSLVAGVPSTASTVRAPHPGLFTRLPTVTSLPRLPLAPGVSARPRAEGRVCTSANTTTVNATVVQTLSTASLALRPRSTVLPASTVISRSAVSPSKPRPITGATGTMPPVISGNSVVISSKTFLPGGTHILFNNQSFVVPPQGFAPGSQIVLVQAPQAPQATMTPTVVVPALKVAAAPLLRAVNEVPLGNAAGPSSLTGFKKSPQQALGLITPAVDTSLGSTSSASLMVSPSPSRLPLPLPSTGLTSTMSLTSPPLSSATQQLSSLITPQSSSLTSLGLVTPPSYLTWSSSLTSSSNLTSANSVAPLLSSSIMPLPPASSLTQNSLRFMTPPSSGLPMPSSLLMSTSSIAVPLSQTSSSSHTSSALTSSSGLVVRPSSSLGSSLSSTSAWSFVMPPSADLVPQASSSSLTPLPSLQMPQSSSLRSSTNLAAPQPLSLGSSLRLAAPESSSLVSSASLAVSQPSSLVSSACLAVPRSLSQVSSAILTAPQSSSVVSSLRLATPQSTNLISSASFALLPSILQSSMPQPSTLTAPPLSGLTCSSSSVTSQSMPGSTSSSGVHSSTCFVRPSTSNARLLPSSSCQTSLSGSVSASSAQLPSSLSSSSDLASSSGLTSSSLEPSSFCLSPTMVSRLSSSSGVTSSFDLTANPTSSIPTSSSSRLTSISTPTFSVLTSSSDVTSSSGLPSSSSSTQRSDQTSSGVSSSSSRTSSDLASSGVTSSSCLTSSFSNLILPLGLTSSSGLSSSGLTSGPTSSILTSSGLTSPSSSNLASSSSSNLASSSPTSSSPTLS